MSKELIDLLRAGVVWGNSSLTPSTMREAADTIERQEGRINALALESSTKSELITAQMELASELRERISELETEAAALREKAEADAAEIATMRGLLEIDPE